MKRIFTALTVAAMSLAATAQNTTLTIHADQGNQKIHKEMQFLNIKYNLQDKK